MPNTPDREFERHMARSMLVSVLWCAVSEHGRWRQDAKDKLTAAGLDVAQLDRMFRSSEPRISLRRATDFLHALGLQIKIEAVGCGQIFTASGPKSLNGQIKEDT